MNLALKIGLPLLLGGAAAFLNWNVLDSELTPHDFVKVKAKMKAGEVFTEDKLEKFTIRSKDGAGSLDGTAVPWKERVMLFNNPCVRELAAGDLVLLRDAPSKRKEVAIRSDERALQLDLDRVKYEPGLLVVGNQIGFVIDRDGPPTPPAAGSPPSVGAGTRVRSFVVEGPYRIVAVGRRVNVQAEVDAADHGGLVLTVAIKTQPSPSGGEVVDEQTNRVILARNAKAISAIVMYASKN